MVLHLIPEKERSQYEALYREVATRQSASVAEMVVLEAFKRSLIEPVREEPPIVIEPVMPNFVGELVSIELSPALGGQISESLVAHAEGDEIVFEGVLADTEIIVDQKGPRRFRPSVLQKFADYINDHGISGDISSPSDEPHPELQELKRKYGHLSNEQFLKAARTDRKGIVKAVKAHFDGVRLWVKGFIDKRYKNYLSGVSKMSIEALTRTEDSEFVDGDVFGLNLVDNRAVNNRSFVQIEM
jgi:hypothetical protein